MSLATIWTILGVLTNWWSLAFILGLLAAAAAFFYISPPIGGPAKLTKIALNPATWLGIAGVFVLIYMGNATKVIEQQKQEIHQDKVQITTTNDNIAVVTDDKTRKNDNHKASGRVRAAVAKAPEGDKVDAALDQISREQCADAANAKRPDCLLIHK